MTANPEKRVRWRGLTGLACIAAAAGSTTIAAPPQSYIPPNPPQASTPQAPVSRRPLVIPVNNQAPPSDSQTPPPQSGRTSTSSVAGIGGETGPVRGVDNGIEWSYIDLPSALRLAGMQNGDLAIAYQRTLASTAAMQLAAARALPNLNGGGNFDQHAGELQQSSANVINVNRSSLYLGAGGNAVAAGSVSVPGVQYNLNLSESIFAFLVTRPQLERSRFLAQATLNELQLQVADAYGDLIRAEARRAIVRLSRDDAADVARVTADFARTGQGRQAEAERGATELERREADLLEAEAGVTQASATLVALLNIQNGIRLRTAEPWLVPRSIVPDPLPLPELLATAVYRRPELAAQRAAIHASLLSLQASKILPFSPQILAGFSGGFFGGGSNASSGSGTGIPAGTAPAGQPRFTSLEDRSDIDAAMYWSLQNLGMGNIALIRAAQARVGLANREQLVILNQVRSEVTEAYARRQTALGLLRFRQQAVEASRHAYDQDFRRVRAAEGRPIEVLDSLRLLYRAREDYVNAIVDYNEAHFALYTAMGQPPADLLARPVNGFNPSGDRNAAGAQR